MNFRILCFIKILQHPLGWQNLNRTIAYTQFHRIKGGSGVPPPSPTTLIEWMNFKDFMNPALCHAGSRIHTISSTLSKVIVMGGYSMYGLHAIIKVVFLNERDCHV